MLLYGTRYSVTGAPAVHAQREWCGVVRGSSQELQAVTSTTMRTYSVFYIIACTCHEQGSRKLAAVACQVNRARLDPPTQHGIEVGRDTHMDARADTYAAYAW
jgi:hypothetical protein